MNISRVINIIVASIFGGAIFALYGEIYMLHLTNACAQCVSFAKFLWTIGGFALFGTTFGCFVGFMVTRPKKLTTQSA